MSSRFPPSSTNDSRHPRDRSPPRPLDRRPSAQFNDGPPRISDPGHRPNDSLGYQGRGREPPREPPRGPKALVDAPRGGGYIPRGRGGYLGRGDAREREFPDTREESFARRGRGQDWGSQDRFDQRPSPISRDRSRSPLSRDFRDTRSVRDYPPREDLRRDSRESLPPVSSETFPRGRGGFRGRGRGRGEWDYSRGRGPHPEERDTFGPRSRSREQEWDRSIRDDRDRDFELGRRDDGPRREREDHERDDRLRREPPHRPTSRNSTGGAPTPLTSRSTSTTSIHQANLERFTQNTRDHRDSLQEPQPRHSASNFDTKPRSLEQEQDKGDVVSKRREIDNFEKRAASPPPQAPPVPAFGSIPQRAPINSQDSQSMQGSPLEKSPVIHPSRLGLLDPPKDVPSAPRAHTLGNAPTAPKAQQAQDKWAAKDPSEPAKRLLENEGNKFSGPRIAPGPANTIAKGPPFDQVRNISKRFPQADLDTSTPRSILPVQSISDPVQPSVRKAVEEQGRNGNASSSGAPGSTIRAPLGDMSNQSSPVKIPTGPRAERAPPPIRQVAPPIARGPPIRGPSMMPRTGRGGAWSWVNPDIPKNAPRGPSQPSIMNVVPTKRDSIGEEKGKGGPPSAESAESAIAKWRRANAPAGIAASQHPKKDIAPSQPSPGIMHRVPTTRDAVKQEQPDTDDSKDRSVGADLDKDEESDEAAAEDTQMDLDEEDFAEAEKKFDREMQALQAKRPPTPRSHPQLLGLLDELDALASALEEKSKMTPTEGEIGPAPVPLGLPSPKVGDAEEMDYKRETSTSPQPTKLRPQTPPVDSLPFLNNGPPTPFSEIEDLQEEPSRQEAIENLLVEKLMSQRELLSSEDDIIRDDFARVYKPWRMSVENFEDERRVDDSMVDPSAVDDMSISAPAPSVVGRRGRVISELGMDEVLKRSQETAAQEERARREREVPIYLPPETFNPDREAVVPDMLNKFEAQTCLYTDTNNLVHPELALDALYFVPRQDDFTSAEKETFLYNYLMFPKRFGLIAEALDGRDFRDCVQHYYLTKRLVKYKDQEAAFLKTKKGKKIANQIRSQIRPRASGLMSTFDGMVEYEAQAIALTEKGRPRRAAAPTFGDVVETETATPAATPARRGATANKENTTGTLSSEKPVVRRTRAPKEKPGRKPKTQLLAAAPGPSPQKGVPESIRGVSKEPVIPETEPRIDELDGAQVLAGLSSAQPYHMQIYPQVTQEAWPTTRPAPVNIEQVPQHVPQIPQEQPHPPPQKAAGGPQTSSYWSVPEQTDFGNYVRHFGTNWQLIAATMKTKTHIMIKNFYSRKIKEGALGQQLEQEAQRADARILSGEDMGPVPAPTPTGEKRRYAYNILKQEQRPLAPSTTENVDVENGSPKPQPTTKTQNTTRFKQDPPKFTALASAEQGAAQTSEQMMAQGPCSLENRITIPLQTKAQQQQQVTGPHLGTFIQAERDRPIFSASHTMKERERELQARQQQLHEVREREAQQHQDREGHTHHRHRVSQQENERPPQPYQHAPNLVSNSLHSSLLGQPPSAAQSGVANTPAIEVKYDERTRIFIQSQQRQQQQQQEQQKKQQAAQQQAAQKHQQQQQQQQHQQAQQQQQRQSGQQTPIQQLLQRSAPIDTSMRRVGPGLFSNTANQLKQSQSPASASQPAPPMSPRGETIRPSSVPVQTMPQQQPPPPVAPPKKSSIMDILNNDSEPPPRKRLSDQPRPAAPTPPSQAPSYQPAGQPMQQIPRRETPLEPLSHLQQQQQQLQLQLQRSILDQLQQQRQSQLREPTRNWAAAAQQLPQQQPSWMEERTSQASAISPPPPQSSFLPPSSRSAFQPLQRNHVPSPPPFPHSGHSRTSSYTSTVAPSHHHSRQQSGLPSTPAEPNIRPSPYASLNPHQQTQQPQQQQQLQMQINQRLALEKQQREAMETEHDYRVRHQREDVLRRTQEHDRLELMKRIQEQEEYERRVGRGGGADYRGMGRGL